MSVSCPYCNHEFAPAETAGRVTCPRCGEAVPVRGARRPAAAPKSDAPFDIGPMVRQRLKQAFVVAFLIMVVIAGFAFRKFRQEQKRTEIPSPVVLPPATHATPPLELRGLGYLPASSNLVFAVQPGPLLAYAERTKQDPVELLTKNRVPASMLGALANAGITLPMIDHIVGGFSIPDENEEPRICLVLVLRQPLPDEAVFLEQLKAKHDEKPGENRFDVRFDNLPMKLAKASPTTWVFGFTEKDLSIGSGLSPSCRELIGEWVPKDAALWIAADSAEWAKKPLLKLLKKEWLPIVSKGRAATVSASFASEAKLRVAVRCANAKASDELFAYFKGKATAERSLASAAGDWVKLELTAEPQDLFATLKGFLDDAGR